jgi:hypothetical protein
MPMVLVMVKDPARWSGQGATRCDQVAATQMAWSLNSTWWFIAASSEMCPRQAVCGLAHSPPAGRDATQQRNPAIEFSRIKARGRL